VSQQLS
jgi:hypothetical protein